MEWRSIPSWEGIFEVSSTGLVRAVERTVVRSDGAEAHYRERILRPTDDSRGYKTISLRADGRLRAARVHRLVAEAFCPREPTHTQVNHRDGNKSNNHADNLEWCTHTRNTWHALERGSRRPPRNRALTADQASAILDAYTNGASVGDLAAQYNVSRATISRIAARQTWKTIPAVAVRSADGWVRHLEEENARLQSLVTRLTDELENMTVSTGASADAAARQRVIALARADALEAEAATIRREYATTPPSPDGEAMTAAMAG